MIQRKVKVAHLRCVDSPKRSLSFCYNPEGGSFKVTRMAKTDTVNKSDMVGQQYAPWGLFTFSPVGEPDNCDFSALFDVMHPNHDGKGLLEKGGAITQLYEFTVPHMLDGDTPDYAPEVGKGNAKIRPPLLRLSWSAVDEQPNPEAKPSGEISFIGYIENLDIEFLLVDKDGIPLRAKCTISMRGRFLVPGEFVGTVPSAAMMHPSIVEKDGKKKAKSDWTPKKASPTASMSFGGLAGFELPMEGILAALDKAADMFGAGLLAAKMAQDLIEYAMDIGYTLMVDEYDGEQGLGSASLEGGSRAAEMALEADEFGDDEAKGRDDYEDQNLAGYANPEDRAGYDPNQGLGSGGLEDGSVLEGQGRTDSTYRTGEEESQATDTPLEGGQRNEYDARGNDLGSSALDDGSRADEMGGTGASHLEGDGGSVLADVERTDSTHLESEDRDPIAADLEGGDRNEYTSDGLGSDAGDPSAAGDMGYTSDGPRDSSYKGVAEDTELEGGDRNEYVADSSVGHWAGDGDDGGDDEGDDDGGGDDGGDEGGGGSADEESR